MSLQSKVISKIIQEFIHNEGTKQNYISTTTSFLPTSSVEFFFSLLSLDYQDFNLYHSECILKMQQKDIYASLMTYRSVCNL